MKQCEVARKVTWKVARKVTWKVARHVSRKVAWKVTWKVARKVPLKVARHVSRKVAGKVAGKVAQKVAWIKRKISEIKITYWWKSTSLWKSMCTHIYICCIKWRVQKCRCNPDKFTHFETDTQFHHLVTVTPLSRPIMSSMTLLDL